MEAKDDDSIYRRCLVNLGDRLWLFIWYLSSWLRRPYFLGHTHPHNYHYHLSLSSSIIYHYHHPSSSLLSSIIFTIIIHHLHYYHPSSSLLSSIIFTIIIHHLHYYHPSFIIYHHEFYYLYIFYSIIMMNCIFLSLLI